MSQLAIDPKQSPEITANTWDEKDYAVWRWYILPLIAAFAVDLFTRLLVDWHLLPGAVRWVSDAAIAAMIGLLLVRMLLLDRIPFGFLLLVFASAIGILVAVFEGQGAGATLYGWWRLFMYPLVGFYIYMMPAWPPDSSKWLMRLCLLILGFEVLIQLVQYATGTSPGDNLAGTLGRHGVGPLVMFILITISLGLGRWLQFGEWRYLAIALVLGTISSALGEMKFFVGGVISLGGLAVTLHLLRGQKLSRVVVFLAILVLAIGAYFYVFDRIFSDVRGFQFQEYILNPGRSIDYLSGERRSLRYGGVTIGRLSEPIYAWQRIRGDATSMLFGNGIGSDVTSQALGFTGVTRASSYYSGTGRSLQMFILEGGLVGMVALAAFFVAVAVASYVKAGKQPGTDIGAIQYGICLFSILWPLWLWYQPVWVQAVPMLVYWTLLGFVLNPANAQTQNEHNAA